jgi:hypothetical protein
MVADLIAQAGEIKGAHTPDLLGRRNVVGVGLGYKFSRGVSTGELSLVVSVTHKVDASALSAQDLVPRELDGFRTDVVELGVLRAFQSDPRDRWRPTVPPGVSVGHHLVTAGTFGCLVRRGDEVFILSNNHVLAAVNDGRQGDPILQPASADGGTADDRIATLADYVPLDFGAAEAECPVAQWSALLLNYVAGALGSGHQLRAVKQTAGVNRVDAALARPISPGLVRKDILHVGAPAGVGTATLATPVQKVGRTTGHTRGTITQVDATLRIDYDGPSALFTGQLVASPMSQRGDSGSAVLDLDGNVVGLLFAGSDAATVINPINEVFSALDVELA